MAIICPGVQLLNAIILGTYDALQDALVPSGSGDENTDGFLTGLICPVRIGLSSSYHSEVTALVVHALQDLTNSCRTPRKCMSWMP